MNLEEQLQKHGLHVSDVKQIYHGRDNWCRCGCGGNYFSVGSVGFKRALNRIQKEDFKPLEAGTEVYGVGKSEGVRFEAHSTPLDGWLNIPYDANRDKCYCLYFSE